MLPSRSIPRPGLADKARMICTAVLVRVRLRYIRLFDEMLLFMLLPAFLVWLVLSAAAATLVAVMATVCAAAADAAAAAADLLLLLLPIF